MSQDTIYIQMEDMPIVLSLTVQNFRKFKKSTTIGKVQKLLFRKVIFDWILSCGETEKHVKWYKCLIPHHHQLGINIP